MKNSHSNPTYSESLTWLERSDYDVVSRIKGNMVHIDLTHKGKVIRTDNVMLSPHYPQYVQKKIIDLFLHFTEQKDPAN